MVKLEHFRALSEKTNNYSKLLANEEEISDMPGNEQ
jgi:hypothetical protein